MIGNVFTPPPVPRGVARMSGGSVSESFIGLRRVVGTGLMQAAAGVRKSPVRSSFTAMGEGDPGGGGAGGDTTDGWIKNLRDVLSTN